MYQVSFGQLIATVGGRALGSEARCVEADLEQIPLGEVDAEDEDLYGKRLATSDLGSGVKRGVPF